MHLAGEIQGHQQFLQMRDWIMVILLAPTAENIHDHEYFQSSLKYRKCITSGNNIA